MHFAFLFNWVGQPWLTQKWSRSIIERYYGGGMANAYLGDEDQGQMSAWFVMAALGSSRQMVVVASSLFMRSLVRYMKRLSLIWANVLAEGKHLR